MNGQAGPGPYPPAPYPSRSRVRVRKVFEVAAIAVAAAFIVPGMALVAGYVVLVVAFCSYGSNK